MAHSILLDTNIISELFRELPAPEVTAWYLGQNSDALVTTSVTYSEILYGIAQMPAGKRRDRYAELTQEFFEREMRGKMVGFDETAASLYAQIRGEKRLRGLAMSPQDAQIAAIARSLDASVATRNVKDFTDCGLVVISPWSA